MAASFRIEIPGDYRVSNFFLLADDKFNIGKFSSL